jgi:hypothetical protein
MNGQFLMNKAIQVQYAFKKDGKGERHGTAAERLLAAQARKNNVLPITARPPPAPPGVAFGARPPMMPFQGPYQGQFAGECLLVLARRPMCSTRYCYCYRCTRSSTTASGLCTSTDIWNDATWHGSTPTSRLHARPSYGNDASRTASWFPRRANADARDGHASTPSVRPDAPPNDVSRRSAPSATGSARDATAVYGGRVVRLRARYFPSCCILIHT